MSSSGEEEEAGPSVDSNDPEERIAARRSRIQRRVEAAKRAALGEDAGDKKEIKEELSKSRKQMEESRLRLTKLRKDGFELVTNIRIAGDARESNRRGVEEETKRQRKDKLDQEGKSSAERFEEITKKWESALQKEVPQSLHEMLLQQKRACDAMNDEKNKLITEFQQELKNKDDQYVKDLKKMAEDVDLMIERMDEQIANVTKAHREELEVIERAFVAERNELLELHKKRWEEKMSLRREKEEEYMTARLKRVDDYEQQLQHLRVQDAEEYNMVKIRLETDVQILEQQLQQMRATYQLNQEKLEYNFQVLKKRDEENTITKSQQKRKITRSWQSKKSNTNLQKKSKHFMATDAKKFHDIWCMNEEECKSLLSDILAVDRVIHEHQLGLGWFEPEKSFTENEGPLLGSASDSRGASASQVLQEVLSQTAHTIKQILELLCDEGGFLVESKLNKLLAPLEKDERSLMKLDAIFTALGVETEEDIHKLSTYFMHLREKAEEEKADELDEEIRILTGKEGESVTSEGDTMDLVHPNEVLKALRAFVEDHRKPVKEKGNKSQFRITALEDRDSSEDSEYWIKYSSMLTEKKERVWDALLDGLEKYSEVLNSRSHLLTETESLRTQNAELRLLLHQYVNSKVNAELEIPPTRVLQLEMNPGH
ncbi:hypothetical protein BaRGS_00036948 [Batillaria attramentaria]|uniref:Dynein regulatory complex protein 1 n=1 Tax=Batillaria attramentaria TaxID=370345 RepID=A0ABD0JAC2_9CAEN